MGMKHISIQQNIKNIYYLLKKESYVKINKNEIKFRNRNPRMTNLSSYDHYLHKTETKVWLVSSDKQIFDSSFENFSLFRRILLHNFPFFFFYFFYFYGTKSSLSIFLKRK